MLVSWIFLQWLNRNFRNLMSSQLPAAQQLYLFAEGYACYWRIVTWRIHGQRLRWYWSFHKFACRSVHSCKLCRFSHVLVAFLLRSFITNTICWKSCSICCYHGNIVKFLPWLQHLALCGWLYHVYYFKLHDDDTIVQKHQISVPIDFVLWTQIFSRSCILHCSFLFFSLPCLHWTLYM